MCYDIIITIKDENGKLVFGGPLNGVSEEDKDMVMGLYYSLANSTETGRTILNES